MIKTIQENWEYIEQWLKNASYADINALHEGATADDIKHLEESYVIRLSDDIIKSYQIHNGVKENLPLFHGGNLLSIDQIVALKEETIKHQFIPLISLDSFATDFIGWDMQQHKIFIYTIQEDNHCYKIYHSETFSTFLKKFVNDLTDGNGIMGEYFN